MNELQCALIKSAFHRYWLSEKHLKLKSVRKEASVVLERVRVESAKKVPALEVISDLRRFMCDVVALSCAKNVEINRFHKNCSVDIWSVMSKVVNTKKNSEKIQLLTGLDGVGIKIATLILSVSYPSRWGYITDASIFYSSHLGFVQWEKTYSQIITADDAIEVNCAMLKISKLTGVEVADLSSALFVMFFYAYKNGFRHGTGKKYGGSYE